MTTPTDQPLIPAPGRLPRRGRRIVWAIGIAGLIVGVIESLATQTDHQLANIAVFVTLLVASLFIAAQLFRITASQGRPWLVPVVLGTGILVLVATFRMDGFSGEMIPQLAYRWTEPKATRPLDMEAPLPELSEPRSDAAVAISPSRGFLGNAGDAIFAERQFAIPESLAEVETLWEIGIGEGWSSFAVVGDRAVTLEQRGDQECVTCYRMADGELLWNVSHTARHEHALGGIGPRSTPAIHDGRVYAQGATGTVWCLELDSGATVWMADLLELAGWDQVTSEAAVTWGRAGSPLIVDQMCIVPLGGPESAAEPGRSLVAFSIDDGTVVWRAGEAQISYASPSLMTLAGVRQIVSVNESTVTGHAIDDGRVLWEFIWPGQSNGGANCASAVPAGKNRFLVGKGYGGGSALVQVTSDSDDKLVATALWESSSVMKTKFTHACIVDGVAYGISNGSLEAIDVASGDDLWRQSRRDRLGQGQIMVAGDVIIGQNESGGVVLYDLNPDEAREWLRIPAMTSKTWNVPTIAGRHLLVRNDRLAFAFLLPAVESPQTPGLRAAPE